MRVYHIVYGSSDAVIDGFTLALGDAEYATSPAEITPFVRTESGGAIINLEASPVIRNCTFRDNNAMWGGAVANYNGEV